jgi:hypothetical protein
MEAQVLARFPDRQPCKQAKDFAELALAHYNEKKKTVCTNLIINCHLLLQLSFNILKIVSLFFLQTGQV